MFRHRIKTISFYWDEWNNFSIANADDGYRLKVSNRNPNGTLGHYPGKNLDYHNGQRFSTYDNDQDTKPYTNCGHEKAGG